jgi:hypothetical protein
MVLAFKPQLPLGGACLQAETWKQWTEFPWVQERDEDTAIRQALNFIEERYQDKTGGGFQRTVSK